MNTQTHTDRILHLNRHTETQTSKHTQRSPHTHSQIHRQVHTERHAQIKIPTEGDIDTDLFFLKSKDKQTQICKHTIQQKTIYRYVKAYQQNPQITHINTCRYIHWQIHIRRYTMKYANVQKNIDANLCLYPNTDKHTEKHRCTCVKANAQTHTKNTHTCT